MLVTFEMVTENLNIDFKVFGKREGNTIIFPDKSTPNTTIYLTIYPDKVEIERKGSVTMYQCFKPCSKEKGSYRNNMGLEFEIYSFTTEMIATENSITIFYEHYIQDNWQSSNKLKILF